MVCQRAQDAKAKEDALALRTANEIVAPPLDDFPLPDSVEGEIGLLGRVTSKVQAHSPSRMLPFCECRSRTN